MQRPFWAAGVTVPSHDLPKPLARVAPDCGCETCGENKQEPIVSEQVGDHRLGPASDALKFCDKTTPSICAEETLRGVRKQGKERK